MNVYCHVINDVTKDCLQVNGWLIVVVVVAMVFAISYWQSIHG
jgi:hypothetical protein